MRLKEYLESHAITGFSSFHDEWEKNHVWQGREVSLMAGQHQVNGVVVGVDQQGALRLSVNDELKTYSGGELSLRLRHDS